MVKPKISVIIPVYNVAPYLSQCLDSVLCQSMPNFEMILINDASTDESPQIICKYLKKDKRIKLITTEKNLGAANCRNLGLNMAKGEFTVFLDADDYFSPYLLAKGLNAFKTTDIDIAYWENYVINEQTKNKTILRGAHPIFLSKISNIYEPSKYPDLAFYILKAPAWNRMFKTEFLKKYNLQFQDLSSINDVYLSRISTVLAKKIVYIAEPLVYYRINRNNQLSNNGKYNLKNYTKVATNLREKLIKFNIFDLYKRAFNSEIISSLSYIISNLNNNKKENFDIFDKENFWIKLNMENLSEKDFISPIYYFNWLKLNTLNWSKFSYTDIGDCCENDENIIKNIRQMGNNFCLWGFGMIGKKLFKIAKKKDLNITCIIDKNEKIAGDFVDNIKIDTLSNQPHNFDSVIITNSNYYTNIREELDKNGLTNVKIIDIDYMITYNSLTNFTQ